MLDKTAYPLPAGLSTDLTEIDGRTCNRLTKSQRAAVGVSVLRGGLTLKPTTRVVGAALGVSPSYIKRAMQLDLPQLHQLRAGSHTLQDITAPSARARFIAAVHELGIDTALEILVAAEAA